jgi:ABC-type uncharacterized transport system substrate-binding protein
MPVFAHPHTYIDAELGIDVGPRGVEGLRFRWAPLRNFCTELAAYDSNADGRFDPDETEKVRMDAFAAIERYHHFIHIDIDGIAYRVTAIEDFSVAMGGGQVYYSFRVPCSIDAGAETRTMTVSMHDETAYVSFALLYVDDGMHDAIKTNVAIVRNGSVYSHGSDFGNQDIVFTFKLANPADGAVARLTAPTGLVPATDVLPVPAATHTNPFVRPGLDLDRAASMEGNPFFSVP